MFLYFLKTVQLFDIRNLINVFGITLSIKSLKKLLQSLVCSSGNDFEVLWVSFWPKFLYFSRAVQSFFMKLLTDVFWIFLILAAPVFFHSMSPSAWGHSGVFLIHFGVVVSVSWKQFVFLWNFSHIFWIILWWSFN